MPYNVFHISLLFIATFVFVGLITPLMRSLAIKLDFVDSPNEEHKTHNQSVPYLGGIAIVTGTLLISYGALFVNKSISSNLNLANSLLIPALLMAIIGLIDDFWKLTPQMRFLFQNIVGIGSTIFLITSQTIGNPTGIPSVDFLITIVWIVGLTNALNFYDNIDGGASGTAALAAFTLSFLALMSGQFLISSISSVITGAALGFLLWNRSPARIYMGDAGALFLGVMLASLSVRLEPNPINKLASFSIPFLVLAMPILDTTVAVFSRIRRGRSVFQGGRDHLSHRLMRLKLSKVQAVIILWALTALFCSLSILISNAPYRYEGALATFSLGFWIILFLYFSRISDE